LPAGGIIIAITAYLVAQDFGYVAGLAGLLT
jgi:hypothetical protein